jgi:hypothetical protein
MNKTDIASNKPSTSRSSVGRHARLLLTQVRKPQNTLQQWDSAGHQSKQATLPTAVRHCVATRRDDITYADGAARPVPTTTTGGAAL